MHLLTTNQAKILKASDNGTGYRTAILHLRPAYSHKGVKTCDGLHGVCAKTCIAMTGRGRFDVAVNARDRRTKMLIYTPDIFMSLLDADLMSFTASCANSGDLPTVRLNGTSDLDWTRYTIPRTGKNVFGSHPEILFYDYSKSASRALSQCLPNYQITFSISEKSTTEDITKVLRAYNVAMVFAVKRGQELPARHKIGGRWYRVVDGDRDDLRLRSRDGIGVIVGLRYKVAFDSKTGKALPADPRFVVTPGEGDRATGKIVTPTTFHAYN
jgi:hypothetical protein